MRALVRLWHWDANPEEMINLVTQTGILGKASQQRVRDVVVRTFLPRYVHGDPPNAWWYLRPFEDVDTPFQLIRPLYYLYAARAEALIADFVQDLLYTRYSIGSFDVHLEDALHFISQAEVDGHIPQPWSESVRLKVARGLLAALRDFGILEGRRKKRIATPFLPAVPFAHIAFLLGQETRGAAVLTHPQWQLFLLDRDGVERLFLEADAAGLLRYSAAGSIVRIDFPEENLHAYSRFLAERAA